MRDDEKDTTPEPVMVNGAYLVTGDAVSSEADPKDVEEDSDIRTTKAEDPDA